MPLFSVKQPNEMMELIGKWTIYDK